MDLENLKLVYSKIVSRQIRGIGAGCQASSLHAGTIQLDGINDWVADLSGKPQTHRTEVDIA